MRESVDASVPCSRCDAAGHVVYVASATPEGVRFSASFQCGSCGAAFEADGNEIPDDVRPLFTKEHGAWRLVVLGLGPERARAMHGLRERLGLSPADVGALLRRAPVEVASGTRVEVEVLRDALAAAGVLVETERCA